MSLNSLLAGLRQRRLTEEIKAAYDEFLARLDAAQVSDQARKIGEQMPAFLLPNAEGALVDSTELLSRGPVVVTFLRGAWCPYCAATLDALRTALPRIEQAGATLVAMTPETGGLALIMKQSHSLHFEILVDVDLAVAMQFGIVFRTPPLYAALLAKKGYDLAERSGNPGWFLPIPATFLVDRHGIIQRTWVCIDFTRRAEPEDVLDSISALR
jgi:peroxiredoxin